MLRWSTDTSYRQRPIKVRSHEGHALGTVEKQEENLHSINLHKQSKFR